MDFFGFMWYLFRVRKREGEKSMVTLARVAEALRPWLGTDFITAVPDICVRAERKLSSFSEEQDDLRALSQGLDSMLYLSVRDATQGRMIVRIEDGTCVRVRVSDFPVMADDLMYLLFERFSLDARHLMLLRDYSVRYESLSAIRALYTRFANYETPQELQALARIARSCHAPFRWRAWLRDD